MALMTKTHDMTAFDFRGSGASAPPADGDYSFAGRAAGILMVDPVTDPRAMPADILDGLVNDMSGPNSAQVCKTYVESIAGSDPAVRKQVIAYAQTHDATARAGTAKALGTWNPDATLKDFKGPMFILLTPSKDSAGALYRLRPDIPHDVVPAEGHWIQMDQPDVVQRAIETFISKLNENPIGSAALGGS